LLTHEYVQTLNHETTQEVESSELFHWPVNNRVLLVEDNHVNQLVAQGILGAFGINTDIVNNGLEALHKLKITRDEVPYNLILMDCQMPEMDGYDTSRSIRAGKGGEQYINIPIIAMTANAMQGDREKCIASGMSDYLTKPIDPDELLNKIKQILISDIGMLTNDSIEINEIKSEIEIWDKTAVLQRLMGNEYLLKTVIEIFIKDVPVKISEMEQAINENDCDLVCRIAHSIKGIAANLSADEVKKISSAIETCAKNYDINNIIIKFSDLKMAIEGLLIFLEDNLSEPNHDIADLTEKEFERILNNLNIKLLSNDFISAEELLPLQEANKAVDSLLLKLIESINNFDNSSALKIIKQIENAQNFQLSNNLDKL